MATFVDRCPQVGADSQRRGRFGNGDVRLGCCIGPYPPARAGVILVSCAPSSAMS